jgi:DNA replication protein DnaC
VFISLDIDSAGIEQKCLLAQKVFYLLSRNRMDLKLKMYSKRYCSILRKTIRRVKKLYYNELTAKSENKNKMTWKIVKNLTGKTQNSQQVFPTFKVDGVEQSPEQAVEAFNNYFLNVTENLNIYVAQDYNPIALLKNIIHLNFNPCR